MEAHWIKPDEIFCTSCGTGHAPTVAKDGAVAVACDHQLTKDEQKAKYAALRAADAGSPAADDHDTSQAIIERAAQIIADKQSASIEAAVQAAVAAALSRASSTGAAS